MAGTVRTPGRSRFPRVTLNSDGQPHRLINALAIFTLIIGLVSFVLGLVIRNAPSVDSLGMAIVTAVTGLLSLLVGLYTQMVSATREQRVIIVGGMIAGFVGLALGLAHGGFSG
jgi:multisubunit Na+/H+ antiporter MnhB subunit